MKIFKIYAFLAFFFLGGTSVSAQSMLDLYFGGNKGNLTIEATNTFINERFSKLQ